MTFLVLGCLAFVFFYIFDLNKLFSWHKRLNIFFAIGIAVLAVSTVGALFSGPRLFEFSFAIRLLWGSLSIITLLLVPYTLFFALPFTQTYLETANQNTVIDTGMYALCRHPGVLWFLLFYLFLWLTSGKALVLWGGLLWTLMDIIHVYVQDRWVFPKIIIGYDQYKDKVPFLIPDRNSIRQAITTFK
ncbi:MAG: hypothetical protein GXY50_00605 [Syntrophomonadaceae bacterium]|nr:hypothetical protein [Syntrophomonadaceae bacterium]